MTKGKAVCIIKPKGTGYSLDGSALKGILNKDELQGRYVVLVSLVGDTRRGKSFLANFFVRYLQSKYGSDVPLGGEFGWLGGKDRPLEGFPWRPGIIRQTVGVWMWSTIFLTEIQNSQKVAIIVLDSQGIYDNESTNQEWATVLSVNCMLSSVVCYNVSQDLKGSDLDNLKYFVENGRIAAELDNVKTPFQKLLFIVRDWQYTRNFGANEGEQYIKEVLDDSADGSQLISCFSKIDCFILPFPGIKVEEANYDGKVSGLNSQFKTNLNDLVKTIFDRDNLLIKEVNGQKLTVQGLVQYFHSYTRVLNHGKLPQVKSLFEATAEANNITALITARELYSSRMGEKFGVGVPNQASDSEFDLEHARIREIALEQFDNANKMGGQRFADKYRDQLSNDIDVIYRRYKLQNTNKGGNIWRKPLLVAYGTIALVVVGKAILSFKWHRFSELKDFTLVAGCITLTICSIVVYKNQGAIRR